MPRYCLDLDFPADGFIDSFLIGNGWLGATVKGGVGTERFDLNLDTVWSGGPLMPEEGEAPARLLADLRDAIRARDYLKADEIGRAMQGKRWTQSYQPLGAIELTYAADDANGYARRLDLGEAVASSSHGTVRLDSFVSNPDGVLVALATGAGIRQDARIGFVSPHPEAAVTVTEESGTRWLVATGRVPANVVPNYVTAGDAVSYGHDAPAIDGTVAAGMGYAVVAALAREPGGGLRLIASAASGYRGRDRRPSADVTALAADAKARVSAALAMSSETLRQRHRDDYRRLFDRVDLDLGGSRAELLFHLGRYLLISSSRQNSEAANLQGIWNVDVRPAWSSNYTININTQMNYWPAEPAGLADLAEPMFALTREIAEAGRATAARYYDAAGSTAHHNTDLWRFTAPVPGIPQWSNWPSGLAWMAAHLEQHIDYGNVDDAFIDGVARPVLRDAAAFALDMLEADGSGQLAATPSTSPEHSFVVDGTLVGITQGTAMDQELIREVLASYVSLADDSLAARSRDALARLRLPVIGPAGNLLEWDDDKTPAELGHRHLSHLYGLYPGTRITEMETPEMFEAARRALYMRLDNGTGYTGWSQAWVLCLAARLGDRALAERSIGGLLDVLTSRAMLVLHPHTDWPGGNVFQIDGNFGAVAGLIELVVQSHSGVVSLLRTLPPSWGTGAIRDIRCRGGHRVSVSWRDGRLVRAELACGATGPLTVELPAGHCAVADDRGSSIATAPAEAPPGRTRLRFMGQGGARYTIAP